MYLPFSFTINNVFPAGLYIKAGLKNIGNIFLMTDAQVAEERFLVLINDLLASGEIPELLADDEIENIINGVRGEVSTYYYYSCHPLSM